MLASPAFRPCPAASSRRRRRRRTGPHQRPPGRSATPRPRPPPLRQRRRAHRRPLPPVARPLGPPPLARLPRGRAPFGRSGARPRPSPPARGLPPRDPRPRQQASAQARPQGAPGRRRPRQLAAPRRRAARAGAARRRSPRRLNRRPPPPRPVLLRPRHLRRAFGLNLSSAIRRLPAGVGFSALKTLSLCHPLHCRPQRLALLLLDHLVAAFSVLELHLTTTEGHAFGALVFLLLVLGMNNRIRCAATATPTQRLKVILQRAAMKGGWAPPCLCEFLNWRSQTVSLLALKGFQGEQNGTDFFKLMLKCAPMLKRITVKLPLEASASNDGCVKICNIFKAHSSVGCDVYHSSGLMHNSQNCCGHDSHPYCYGFMVCIDKIIL